MLDGATFSIHAGDKAGLVGRNGAGKTTLLRTLAGEAPALEGHVIRKGALGYLRQEPRGASGSAGSLSYILSGRGLDEEAARLEKLREALEETASARNVQRFSRAEEMFRLGGGYSAEAEARRIAAGLGLQPSRLDLPPSALSGGERRRLELSRILFAGSDLLLLDEPTNHLDIDAKQWLMRFLRAYRGALLVVSHDLDLLDDAVTRVLHLDEGQLVEYKGTYSEYLDARATAEERRRKDAARRDAEMKRLKGLADAMRHQSQRRARTAKVFDARVERLRAESVQAPRSRRAIKVRLPEPPRVGDVALEADGLAKGYGGPAVFEDVCFDAGRGERLLVIGLNGAGKTTLLRILAGAIEPDDGRVRWGHGASVGYYAQEHEGIAAGRSVLAHMTAMSNSPPGELRGVIGMFGLSGDIAFQDAGTLSGGEKTKLALAQLVAGRHNVLLLDEPTNNLDPPSRTAIARALAKWPGTMVVVTHDPEFVEALEPDRVLMMPEGAVDLWRDEHLELVALA